MHQRIAAAILAAPDFKTPEEVVKEIRKERNKED
jgi:hypothetical protein